METPKGFFRLLQADHRRFHKIFADHLQGAGFDVRRVRRREFRNVWEVYVRRGNVPADKDQQTMCEVICAALRSLGLRCALRDVDLYQRGDRLNAAFFCHKGGIGTLSIVKGEEKWSAEPWP
jgi:hypothetical protein